MAQAANQKMRDVIALDEAMSRLAEFGARKGKVVELRVFGGLEVRKLPKFWVSR